MTLIWNTVPIIPEKSLLYEPETAQRFVFFFTYLRLWEIINLFASFRNKKSRNKIVKLLFFKAVTNF